MIASERNLENSSNEVLIVSRNYCIIDFVKSIIGENVTHKIQSQLVEMSFLVSTFVFLDASFVNLENYEAVNSFIGKIIFRFLYFKLNMRETIKYYQCSLLGKGPYHDNA